MNKRFLSVISLVLAVLLTFCSCGGSLNNGDILPEPEKTTTADTQNEVVSLDDIPEYSGSPYVAISDNQPSFTEEDYTTKAFEKYAKLDKLGR